MVVRPVTQADAAHWLRMRQALWPDADDHADEIRRYFAGASPAPPAVLIAVDAAGAALGFAELGIRNYAEEAETDRVAYLEGWYVEPHARLQGVGRALVDAAEAWGRAQGCREFGSDTNADNDASAAAHRALGFTDTGLIRCFLKKL